MQGRSIEFFSRFSFSYRKSNLNDILWPKVPREQQNL